MKTSELVEQFSKVDTSGFPDFYGYRRILERGLWVLWVAKEKLGIRKLTAEQIASIIRDVKEISTDAKSITNAFNRAGDKIRTYQEDGNVYFGIMKPGKDHLASQLKEGSIEVLYFEPDKKYTSKRVLTRNILSDLSGELRIVDPYCGESTLDTLGSINARPIKFLTRIENLREREGQKLSREIKDFKSENPDIEFRSYPHPDIHDRYIISSDCLVIIGHSIKDLGSKESFAIVLNAATSRNIVEALSENFNRRWEQSDVL